MERGIGHLIRDVNTPYGPLHSTSIRSSSERISVIIPAYQCAAYIRQAVQSVIAQTFPAYEIIVVNDGSPDTPALEAALAPFEANIRYLKQENRGPAFARNRGTLQAAGKYIAFLDADDYWRSDHLERQIAILRGDPTLDLVYCNSNLMKDERPFARAFDVEPQSEEVSFETLLVERSTISTSSAVVSREAILRAGLFDESFLRCEDFDMWLRMAFVGVRMSFHSEACVYHRVSDAGLSADRWSMKQDRIRVYRKVAATLPISESQRRIVREMAAKTEAQCDVERMKSALEAGEYAGAIASAQRAVAIENSWKLRVSLTLLRIWPALFRRLHLIRASLMRRNRYSSRPGASFGAGEDGTRNVFQEDGSVQAEPAASSSGENC
jgi:GT2 family glycosyltransferase